MTTVKTKKRLMYVVFSCVFIFGGIEYAVILPTLWLYLHNTYDAPEYMLGLVLSSYSIAAFISAPIFGRILDRFGRTKQIFLVCATLELVGSFLYFIGISEWLAVASRFISGLGGAGEAIALAEVSRYTSEKERTSIMSYLVATRQIALLIGPGLNLFLRIADFKLGPFDVNKYSAPGAFMSIMWIFLMVIVVTLYTEPREIYSQENFEQKVAQPVAGDEGMATSVETENEGSRGVMSSGEDSHIASIKQIENTASQGRQDKDKFADKRQLLQSDDSTDFVYPPLVYEPASQRNQEHLDEFPGSHDSRNGSIPNGAIPNVQHSLLVHQRERSETAYESNFSSDSGEFHDVVHLDTKTEHTEKHIDKNLKHESGASGENIDDPGNTARLSSSLDLMLSAERLIENSSTMYDYKDAAEMGNGLVFDDDHFGVNVDNFYNEAVGSGSAFGKNGRSSMVSVNLRSERGSNQASFVKSTGTNDPYIERSMSGFNDPIAVEGKLGFFCNEYIRDEIVAIICLLFCAMFSQICVETMVLPLSLKYMDFSELENSLLYCACGVEIILVFLLMSRLSRHLSDRAMMMFGVLTLLASNIWLLYYLPTAPPHNRSKNIPFFGIAVFLDVLSLPFLLVTATSLYSKLTRRETQGLSQGLRRGIVGLGTILAPMWGSSAANEPYVLLGVLVGLQALSTILCTLSFKRLKVRPRPALSSPSSSGTPTATTQDPSINSNPLDLPTQNNHNVRGYGSTQDNRPPSSGRSTPYGSINRSIAGSSYRSVDGSSDEERPLLSRPVN